MTAKKPAVAKKAGKSSTGIAAGLEKLGLRRPLDFALHLPLRYEDHTHVTLLADAPAAGPALFAIKVRAVTVAFRPRRQLVVQVEDDSGRANLRIEAIGMGDHALDDYEDMTRFLSLIHI